MGEDLDRRIAVEVMGEPEPEKPELVEVYSEEPGWEGVVMGFTYGMETPSPGGNWFIVEIYEHGDEPEWQPVGFSSRLRYAMRAVDKHLDGAGYKLLRLGYEREHHKPWSAWFDGGFAGRGDGDTAPEAICRLLLTNGATKR